MYRMQLGQQGLNQHVQAELMSESLTNMQKYQVFVEVLTF